MRKFFIGLLMLVIALLFYFKDQIYSPQQEQFQAAAKAMLVMNADSGKILFEVNGKEQLPIASMSKMMTQYLTLNAIKSGASTWDDLYHPSEAVLQIAALSGVAKLNMTANHTYTLKELFTAATVNSSNDATVALAEMVSGTEDNFVTLMNEQATYFGLKNTTFYNATGLDGDHLGNDAEKTNTASARDVATIAQNLLEKHPEIFEFTTLTNFETSTGRQLWSSNLMLPGMPQSFAGIDGLKTGYTHLAGSCFASTGVFNDQRIITIVMDAAPDEEDAITSRFTLTQALIEQIVLH